MINIKDYKLGKPYKDIDLLKAIEEGKFNVGDKFYNEQLKMIFEVKRDNEEAWFLGSKEEFESGISCFINNFTYRKVEG